MARIHAPLFSYNASGKLGSLSFRTGPLRVQRVQPVTSISPLAAQRSAPQRIRYRAEVTHWSNTFLSARDREAWARAGTYLKPRLTGYQRVMADYLAMPTAHAGHCTFFTIVPIGSTPGRLNVVGAIAGPLPSLVFLHYARSPFITGSFTSTVPTGGDGFQIIVNNLPTGLYWFDIRAVTADLKVGETGLYLRQVP